MLRDVASMRAITSLLVFLGVCAAGFSPRTSPQKVPNTSTNYHLADQLRSQVEFFSHIMHTGGTAWSKWVQHVYGVDTVAPGSATAAPLYSGQKAPYAPQFDILRDAIEECNANASCQAPKYRVAFGHSTPDFPLRLGLPPRSTYAATILRDPIDMAIHVNLPNICYEAQSLKAYMSLPTHNDVELFQQACHSLMELGAWTHKRERRHPAQPSRSHNRSTGLFSISGSSNQMLELRNSLSQVDWLLGCKPEGGVSGKDNSSGWERTVPCNTQKYSIGPELAFLELEKMPWFGLLEHWVGATCLWHFVHERSFPLMEPAHEALKRGMPRDGSDGNNTDSSDETRADYQLGRRRSVRSDHRHRTFFNSQAQPRQRHRSAYLPLNAKYRGRNAEKEKQTTFNMSVEASSHQRPQLRTSTGLPDVKESQHRIRNLSATAIVRNTLLLLQQQRERHFANSSTRICAGTECLYLQSDSAFLDREWRFYQFAHAEFEKRMHGAANSIAKVPNALSNRYKFLPSLCFEESPPNGFKIPVSS